MQLHSLSANLISLPLNENLLVFELVHLSSCATWFWRCLLQMCMIAINVLYGMSLKKCCH